MDEELAELTADVEASTEDPELPISEMTADLQSSLRIEMLLRSLLQQKSKKKMQFPRLPTPKTARQKVLARRRDQNRGRLLARIAEAQARWQELERDGQL